MDFSEAPQDPVFANGIPLASRRRMLAMLGGVALSGLCLPARSQAAEWVKGNSIAAAVWNKFLDDYAAFLGRQHFRNITVSEIIYAHLKMHGSVRNTPPPRSMWRNIVPTLRVADRLAGEMRSPLVEIVSAYRSPAYNATCPGAVRDSMHKHNLALDLRYAASPATVANTADKLRSRRYFSGGIGRYDSFTHVDTRGSNVDWHG